MSTPLTTLELVRYYANLLIKQYLGKPKAYATIQGVATPFVMPQTSTQNISFSIDPSSGSFVLSYNGNNSAAIQWNDSVSTIQTTLRAVPGLSSVTVTGSISSQLLTVTFVGVISPALSLEVVSNSLGVSISIVETDLTLPLAIQNAYNLTVQPYAVGKQLDVLGKYAGVTRNGVGFQGQPITLDDSDFLVFVKMAIVTNSSGSSLYDIVNNIFMFFSGSVLVFDYADMRMTYLINSSVGSQNLIELFVTEGLLPKPMGVQLSIIVAPVINSFFGFVSYDVPIQPVITRPFNSYDDYHTDWPWLTYADSFIA